MSDLYYYTHDDQPQGPYSAREMRQMAASGEILHTDTVWKEGASLGLEAGKVGNLFPRLPIKAAGRGDVLPVRSPDPALSTLACAEESASAVGQEPALLHPTACPGETC